MSTSDRDAPLYLCMDQGGHSSRALVIDAEGEVHAAVSKPIETQRDGERVEHDPSDLVDTLLQSASEAVSQLGHAANHIVAAGLATQRSSIVCWDNRSGAALSPVLSWQDTRAANWLAAYESDWQRVHEITGLVLSPHYGVSKLIWCLDHLPAVAEAANHGQLCFGPLASFLAMRVTQQTQSFADPANASRTLLWDRMRRDWSDELLQLFGVPGECLPPTKPSRHDWGTLSIGGQTIPLTVVTGDQSAALFAFGMPAPGTTYINIGTGAFVQRALTGAATDPGRLLASVVYQDADHDTSVIEGTVNGAGSALSLVAEQLHVTREQLHAGSAQWLEQAVDPPLFVNGIAGLGSPWWRTDQRSYFDADEKTGCRVGDEARLAAVLESIVFLLTVNLRHIEQLLGPAERIVATGGLAAVDPLLQRLSNLSGTTVQRADAREATAAGLAFLLAGLPTRWPDVTAARTFLPTAAGDLEDRFAAWQALMPPIMEP